MEHADVFRSNYLVVGLPEPVIDEIAELAECAALAPRETLISKGQLGSDLYVLLSGRVNILTPAGDKLAEAGPGSVIGEVALVDDQPRSADVIAISMVKFARLPAASLRKFMATNKDAGFVMLANLARVLSMRLRNSAVVLEDLKERAKDDPWKYAL